MRKFFVALLVLTFLFAASFVTRADELDDITKQLSSLKEDLKNKEANFDKMNKQLEGIRARVVFLEGAIVRKEKEVKEGEKALDKQKQLLNERAKSYYKNISKTGSPILSLLIADSFSESLKNFFYQKTIVDEDKKAIIKIVLFIKGLEEKKAQLESESSRLAKVKIEVDAQSKLLAGEISGVKQKVAQLTEKQQSLIASKLASIYVPRSAGTSAAGCSSDLTNGKNPGFSPRLGFFSYGGNTHGNGMNQYGALGRAKEGQDERRILEEYYPGKSLKTDYDKGITITTTTGWSGSIEDYVKRIYEVPASWPMQVLKAQAVAARSYALNVTANGSKPICTSESCQVFKPEPKGGDWETAVNETAGWVLMDGGNPAFTQYASTHGGYIRNLNKFDGSGGSPGSFADVSARAYDRESPWFYCDWGSRSEYGGTAWLKQSEVADIANAILLAKRDSSAGPNLSPPDQGGWDMEKVKSELRKYRNPFNNVSSVSIGADFGSGVTTNVTVSGDAGSESFSGQEWKDWFNLRAPANIQIKSRLYNVEIQ